jgi:hypothetical protein
MALRRWSSLPTRSGGDLLHGPVVPAGRAPPAREFAGGAGEVGLADGEALDQGLALRSVASQEFEVRLRTRKAQQYDAIMDESGEHFATGNVDNKTRGFLRQRGDVGERPGVERRH